MVKHQSQSRCCWDSAKTKTVGWLHPKSYSWHIMNHIALVACSFKGSGARSPHGSTVQHFADTQRRSLKSYDLTTAHAYLPCFGRMPWPRTSGCPGCGKGWVWEDWLEEIYAGCLPYRNMCRFGFSCGYENKILELDSTSTCFIHWLFP